MRYSFVGFEERGDGDVRGLTNVEDVSIGDAEVEEARMIVLIMMMIMWSIEGSCGSIRRRSGGLVGVFAGMT